MLTNSQKRVAGMSMPELLVAATVFGFLVAGSTGAALMFTKIASNHESNSEFQHDIRVGFEALAYDVRNATRVVSRSETGFALVHKDESNVPTDIIYAYDRANGIITRTDEANSVKLFNHVTDFDVLVDETDALNNPSLSYGSTKLSIELLRFEASNGGGPDSQLSVTNFTFKIRNSQ